MVFKLHHELRLVEAKIGWLCVTLICCIISFLALILAGLFLEPATMLRTSVLMAMVGCVIIGVYVGVAIDKAIEQRRNLKLQVRNELERRK